MVTPASGASSSVHGARSWRKWIVGGLLALFFGYLLWEVVNPYRGQSYEEVPHGDHVHYVPKDRDPDVPMSQFPTHPPGETERITPNGDVVPTDPE